MQRSKTIIVLHCVSVVTILSLISILFLYRFEFFTRFWLSLRSLWLAIKYYFQFVTNRDFSGVYPPMPYDTISLFVKNGNYNLLPFSFSAFKEYITTSLKLLVNRNYLILFFSGLLSNIQLIINLFINIILLLILLKYIFSLVYYRPCTFNFVRKKSQPLKVWEKIYSSILNPLTDYIKMFIHFFFSFWYYSIPFFILLAADLGFLYLPIDFIGLYFRFFSTFDFIGIYKFFFVFVHDTWQSFTYLFLLIIIILIWLWKRHQKKVGYRRNRHLDSQNKGFVNSLASIVAIIGGVRDGKTTLATDMAINSEELLRYSLKEIIDLCYKYFPKFNWVKLGKLVVANRDYGKIHNRYQARLFSRKLSPFDFGFNEKDNPVAYDGLRPIYIDTVMELFCEVYFYYTLPSSLMLSNYPISFDGIMIDHDSIPIWNYDIFERDYRQVNDWRSYSKVVSWNAFRMGLVMPSKKIVQPSDYRSQASFDLGIAVFQELSNERGNQFDNEAFKRSENTINPVNDLADKFFSIFGHMTLINFKSMARIFFDHQRLGQLAASFGQLAGTHLVVSRNTDEFQSTLPMWHLMPILYEITSNITTRIHDHYYFYRSDETLMIRFVDWLSSVVNQAWTKASNNFGYKKILLHVVSGNDDTGAATHDDHPYYILRKKIYTDRFKSDSLREVFIHRYDTDYGFIDLPSYSSLAMSAFDYKQQGAFFYERLLQYSRIKRKVFEDYKKGTQASNDGVKEGAMDK